MSPEIVVTLSVVTATPEMTTKAVEVLSRALAGIALEGLSGASLNAYPVEEDDS